MLPKITYLDTALFVLFAVVFSQCKKDKNNQPQDSQEKEIFRDDFNSANSNWWWTGNNGDSLIVKIENGYYYNKNTTSSYWVYNLIPRIFSDNKNTKIIEMALAPDGGSNTSYFGMIWNYSHENNDFIDCEFLISVTGAFSIWKSGEGSGVLALKNWVYSNAIRQNDENILKVEKMPDDHHKFYINGQLVAELDIPGINNDKIGFLVGEKSTFKADYIRAAEQ